MKMEETFDYKTTNAKLEFEKEYDNTLINEDHIDEEEILLLKELNNRFDFYELVCSEPNYYLKLLETNSELKYLLEDYELFFIRETASEGCKDNLRIKFKIMKEDQFTEVGFFSDADDTTSYKEFILQAKRLLSRTIIKGESCKSCEERPWANVFENEKENIFEDHIQVLQDLQDLQDLQVLKEDYETLNSLIKICPEHLSSKYKQMLHNIKNKKSNTVMPPKSLFYKMMQVYNSTNDDIIKYEIDKFLYE